MSDTILRFENIGKLYRLGTIGTQTLSRDFARWWTINVLRKEDPYLKIGESNDRTKKGKSDLVWALRDITFDVSRGDVVGIIGQNGAGKSTLLKLLSRITSPTTGTISSKGRIASLLEVGTGFHGELTGRENLYMNGSILGMTKKEMKRKFDEIVDFAGVERYIDTPIKRYSSGMIVRLGFAIAAFLEPEILVVDEVLAVGDAEFQKKAIGKMQDLSVSDGRTVLFVSHNMASIKSLCNRGIVLDKGMLTFDGTTEDAISEYSKSSIESTDKKIIEHVKWSKPFLKISDIRFNESDATDSFVSSAQKTIHVEIEGFTDEDFTTDLMIYFKTHEGIVMASLAEGHNRGRLEHIAKGSFKIERFIKLPKFLSTGNYIVDIHLHHPMVEFQMNAPGCCTVHIDGYQEGFGRSLDLNEHGFIGLETV